LWSYGFWWLIIALGIMFISIYSTKLETVRKGLNFYLKLPLFVPVTWIILGFVKA
jgi:hypothetical protein